MFEACGRLMGSETFRVHDVIFLNMSDTVSDNT